MKDVTFFPIPKPKTRQSETLEWAKACNRKDFTFKNVNKHSYVCSKHFVDGRPTAQFPCPVIAGATSKQQTKLPKRSLNFVTHKTESKATHTLSTTQDQVSYDVPDGRC